jgi:hypothetical protein
MSKDPKVYDELFEKYPQLFRRRTLSAQETCMCWGIRCGIGWYEIIDELCADLHKLFTELKLEGEDYPAVEQVKEKLGTLRFYMDDMKKLSKENQEKVHTLIADAERRTEVTCERCGRPGEVAPGAWISVLCGVCRPPQKNQ